MRPPRYHAPTTGCPVCEAPGRPALCAKCKEDPANVDWVEWSNITAVGETPHRLPRPELSTAADPVEEESTAIEQQLEAKEVAFESLSRNDKILSLLVTGYRERYLVHFRLGDEWFARYRTRRRYYTTRQIGAIVGVSHVTVWKVRREAFRAARAAARKTNKRCKSKNPISRGGEE